MTSLKINMLKFRSCQNWFCYCCTRKFSFYLSFLAIVTLWTFFYLSILILVQKAHSSDKKVFQTIKKIHLQTKCVLKWVSQENQAECDEINFSRIESQQKRSRGILRCIFQEIRQPYIVPIHWSPFWSNILTNKKFVTGTRLEIFELKLPVFFVYF